MYIETRTSAEEVMADVLKELEYKANSVRNQAQNRLDHPTFITLPALRAEANQLQGMYSMAIRVVGGIELIPDALIAKVIEAQNHCVRAGMGKRA